VTAVRPGSSWIAEYADPDKEADWAFLREYSSYHNVRAGQPCPPALFITSSRDDRVDPGHARKMVSRPRQQSLAAAFFVPVQA
jgi:prolyl oligopeptidase